MQQLRIDPLSGLRVATGPEDAGGTDAPGGAASVDDDPLAGGRGQPQMFAARPGGGTVEEIVSVAGGGGGGDAGEPAGRGHGAGPSGAAPTTLLDLGADGLAATMELWRERMRARADAPFRHLTVDEGGPGGDPAPSAARLHTLPFVPAAVARERERFTAYRDRTQGRNLLEDLLTEEVRRGERVVVVDREAIAICPFASAVPFQLQVVPRRPAARFEDDGPLGAAALHRALELLAARFGTLPPLRLWVRTAPSGAEAFCWRIDLWPRLGEPGGLELGTGVWFNELAPERAAAELREAGEASEPRDAGGRREAGGE